MDRKIKFLEKQLEHKSPLKESIKVIQPDPEKALSTQAHPANTPPADPIEQNLELRKYLKIPSSKENDNPFIKIFQKKQERLESLTKKQRALKNLAIDKESLLKEAKAFKKGSRLLVGGIALRKSQRTGQHGRSTQSATEIRAYCSPW